MELVGDRNPIRKKKTILVKHGEQTVSFISVKLGVSYPPPKKNEIRPVDPKDEFDIVAGPINAYWASLPKERQDAIFEVYLDAKEIFEDSDQRYESIHNDLIVLVAKLYKLQPYEEIREFIMNQRTIKIPMDLKREYDADSPNNGRTYLLEDYMELMCLAVALKPMLPIWGQYLEGIAEDVGNAYKEDHAASLLNKTNITRQASYQRLERYIEAYTSHPGDDIGLAAVLGFMSTVEFPKYLLNLLLLKKLCVSKMPTISSPLEPFNLIREIYLFVKLKVEKPETIFMDSGNVRDKSKSSLGNNEEDNTSKLEGVKLKEELDKGTVTKYSIQVQNDMFIPKRIEHTINESHVRESIAMVQRNRSLAISPVVVPLIQYAITGFKIHHPKPEVYKLLVDLKIGKDLGDGYIKSTVFNPKVVEFLEMEDRLLLMAYSQALYAHWGFYNLAALLTSQPTSIPNNVMLGQIVDSVDAELVDKAIRLYPNLVLSPAARTEFLALQDKAKNSANEAQSYMKKLVDHNPLLSKAGEHVKAWSKYTWKVQVPSYLKGLPNFKSFADNGDITLRDQSVNNNQSMLPSSLKNELVKMVLESKIKG